MHDLYSEGIRIANEIKALDGPNVAEPCHSRLYTHGHRVERSLTLLHGFTRCPQQLDRVGRELYERGWNVFIPRYPRHGYSDRFSRSITELRADHLIALANRAALVGSGLGEHLTVAGVELGAILAGLLAATRDDVYRAVLQAPRVRAIWRPNLYVWRAYLSCLATERRFVEAERASPPKAHSVVVTRDSLSPQLIEES
ncbi:MAG: hypothetical protein E6J20_15335 [Chloroflexi bacterium]|nr:MAG: hypothetical protein E6J20_15335 [Chloroflexota bacterium]